MDLSRQLVERDGRATKMRTKEAQLLAYLASRPNREITREELLTEVWGYRPGIVTRTVDNTVRRLRCRIEDNADAPDHIITVYGRGYRFVPAKPVVGAAPDRPLEPLIGRAALQARIREALEQPGFVTLLGAPGVGKSRLALELAERWDGGDVFRCDLASAPGPGEALDALCATLGLPSTERADQVWSAIDRAIGDRKSLLLLDNFEHLVENSHRLPQRWARDRPNRRTLVTSRIPLQVSGERCVPIGPLPLEDALILFEERARASGAAFEAPRPELERLLETIGRLPLAIELVAANTHLLTIEELIKRGAASLSSPRRDTPERHSSLQAAFEISWEQLSPRTQTRLAACSVFPHHFTLAAAAEVLDLSNDTLLADLGVLTRHSLITRSTDRGRTRFQLVPALRALARARIVPDAARLMSRHAEWTVRTAEALRDPVERGLSEAVRELDRLRPDLTLVAETRGLEEAAAAGRLLALSYFRRRPRAAVMEVLDTAVSVARSRASRSETLFRRASAHLLHGRPDAAQADLAHARRLGLPESLQAHARHIDGVLLHQAGDREAAHRAYLDALEQSPEVGLRRARVLLNLGILARDSEESTEAYLAARDAALAADDRSTLGRVENSLGLRALERGELAIAETHLRRAMELTAMTGNLHSEAMATQNLSLVSRCRGDLEAALSLAEVGLETAQLLGSLRLLGTGLHRRAGLRALLGDLDGARADAKQALSAVNEAGDTAFVAFVLELLAHIDALEGRCEAAALHAEESIQAYAKSHRPFDGAFAAGLLAASLAEAGRSTEADGALQRARELSVAPGPTLEIYACHLSWPPAPEAVADFTARATAHPEDVNLTDALALLRARLARA